MACNSREAYQLHASCKLVREECKAENFNVVLSLPEFQEQANLYEQSCKDKNDGPLKMFWNSYLEMVATLLSLIRPTREGNWELHLECINFLHMTTPITHGIYQCT